MAMSADDVRNIVKGIAEEVLKPLIEKMSAPQAAAKKHTRSMLDTKAFAKMPVFANRSTATRVCDASARTSFVKG